MWTILKILLLLLWFAFLAVGAGRALFTGQSHGARSCTEFTWQKGDKTKGFGQDVVSPCTVSDLP